MIEFLTLMLAGLIASILYAGYQIGRLVEVQSRPIQMQLGPEWMRTAHLFLERLDRIADKSGR